MLFRAARNARCLASGVPRLVQRSALRTRRLCVGAPPSETGKALPWRLLEPFKNPKIDLASALRDGWKPLDAAAFAASLQGAVLPSIVFVPVQT